MLWPLDAAVCCPPPWSVHCVCLWQDWYTVPLVPDSFHLVDHPAACSLPVRFHEPLERTNIFGNQRPHLNIWQLCMYTLKVEILTLHSLTWIREGLEACWQPDNTQTHMNYIWSSITVTKHLSTWDLNDCIKAFNPSSMSGFQSQLQSRPEELYI